jgi:folate-binding protein YgfZ
MTAAEGMDVDVPAHYGDPLREQRTLAETGGMVDRSNREVIAVTGPERLTWLHDITTQHLLGLPPYQGTETLVLSPHGHVEHHAMLVDDGETTWLDTEPGYAAGLLDFLTKMRFFAKVELREATDEYAVLSAFGDSYDLAPPEILPLPGPKFATGTVPARPTARYAAAGLPGGGIARRTRLGVDLLVPRSRSEETLRQAAARCGIWGDEALRVAARIARLGVDTDHRTLPHEVGWLATDVHLEKGCYRGQETVARVHHLGRPPRRLVLLHLDGSAEELPSPGTDVEYDSRRIGFLGTAVHHYELGPIALAVIKHNVPDDAALTTSGMAAAIDPGRD